jgi:hypothetical protein
MTLIQRSRRNHSGFGVLLVANPVTVIEILSPSTGRNDSSSELAVYFAGAHADLWGAGGIRALFRALRRIPFTLTRLGPPLISPAESGRRDARRRARGRGPATV